MVDNSKYTPNPRKFYKSNFVELLELLTPQLYVQEDLDLSGTAINPLSRVVNTHLQAAKDFPTILPLSSIPGTQTSELSSLAGISQYFVKQNGLTNITPQSFSEKIILPLGVRYSDYDTSGDFKNYLSSTLIPKLVPPGTATPGTIESNTSELSAYTGDSAASSIHNYLVDNLGWFYFLNTSALGGLDYSPSSFVLDNLTTLYLGNTLETVDGVKGFTEYMWRNVEACSFGQYIPLNFLSGAADAITDPSAGELATYTSGTQKLDSLKTLLDVIYSPLALDRQDYTVKESFDNFIDADLIKEDRVSDGPHRKIMTALGFHYADISDQVENLKYIYDIEDVDSENLKYIADLVGFKLRGNESNKWRHQLRVAADIYKKAGTEQALRSALNAIVVNSILDLDGKITPLWESYLPFLIWYALGTGSPLFKSLKTWTPQAAKDAGVVSYSSSSLEENLKSVTDTILLDLISAFPKNFKYFGKEFPLPSFYILNEDGTKGELYTVLGDPLMKPWHAHTVTGPGYQAIRRQAQEFGEEALWDRAVGPGPFGEGVYMTGKRHPLGLERPTYLVFDGDPEFLFSYRGKVNYPLPPFEEVKYYRDSTVSQPLVDLLVEKLKCFQVEDTFADQVGDFITSGAVTTETNIGSLNEFLMFFSSVQNPPNYDDVMFSISDYEKNLLSLWNGKSSHIFLDFDETGFDFRKVNLEADSKYALYETARVAQEYSPAHTIPRVNLNASAAEDYLASGVDFLYAALDHADTRAYYGSGTVLGNSAVSGVILDGVRTREGFLTFGREAAVGIDSELSSVYNNFIPPPIPPASTERYIIAHELSSNTIEETKQIAADKRATRLQRPVQHFGSFNLDTRSNNDNIDRAWMAGDGINSADFVDPRIPNIASSAIPHYRFRASASYPAKDKFWQSNSGLPFPQEIVALNMSSTPNDRFAGTGADLELTDIKLSPGPVVWDRLFPTWTSTATGYGGMSSIANLKDQSVIFPPANGENNQVIYGDQRFNGRDFRHFNVLNYTGEMIFGLVKEGEYDPATFFSGAISETSGFYFGAKVDSEGKVIEMIRDGDGLSGFEFTTSDGFNAPTNAIRFGIYRSYYPYVLTSPDSGSTWRLCAMGNRAVDKVGVPFEGPSTFYRMLIKNLDSDGASITARANQNDPNSFQYANIAGGSQWTSNVYKIALDNSGGVGGQDDNWHYLRPGDYIWRNVEVDGRNANARPQAWLPEEDLLLNPDMKWGTREYSLSSRSFFDCDWSHIALEHCAYIATNGPVRVEGCTASSIGSQGLQWSYRSSPYGTSYPTGDNSPFTHPITHTIKDSHYVDCGFEGDRPAFTWTFFTPGNSQYPASIHIKDSTMAERYIRPIDDSSGDKNGGLSRKSLVVAGKQQGTSFDIFNIPDSEVATSGDLGIGAYKDQFRRVTDTSSTYRWNEDTAAWENFGDITGNLTKEVRMQNTAIHTVKQGATGHISLRGVDEISFEHCAFIYDPEDPNWSVKDYKISIDTESIDNDTGESELTLSPSGAPDTSAMQSRYLTIKNCIAVLPENCPDARVIFRVNRTVRRGEFDASGKSTARNDFVFTHELDATNNLNRVIRFDLSSLDPSGGFSQTPTILEDREYDVALDGPYPTTTSGSGGDTPTPPLTDPPGKIQMPYPADGQTGISLDTVCSWAPTANATAYDVTFGEGSLPEEITVQNITTPYFNPVVAIPSGLSYDTSYSWKVDTKNAIGTTQGDTLTFTTESEPPPAPGQATNFLPTNGATGVSITQSCSWDAATNASSYDVYFGTTTNPIIRSSEQAATSFNPEELEYSTVYYWRIDPRGSGGVTTGAIISFTTEDDPGSIINPPDEVTVGFPNNFEVSSNPVTLDWTAPGNDPSGYDVFFGTTPGALDQISTDQTNTTTETSSLSAGTTYYWDVTAKNSVGSTAMASEFSFSTMPAPLAVSAGQPHEITIAPTNPILTWNSASGATSYDVYFGRGSSDFLNNPVANVEGLSYNPGTLPQNEQFFWSIVSKNAFGETIMPGGNSQGGEEGEDPTEGPGTGFFYFLTSELPPSEIIRNDLRRRNLRYLLPEFGYYDRTGFNAPISYDPSVLEMSMLSSLGELTLGYVASAGAFFPVEDYTNVSGVWHICEGLQSPNVFSGVDTSNTFPYRGLKALGSDAKNSEITSATDRYVDRGQTPKIIQTMHSLFENKSLTYAQLQVSADLSSYAEDAYWKDQAQSFSNSAIASGYVLNSYSDYENFSFGRGIQRVFKDYCNSFGQHALGPNMRDKTGGNIFAHVFGKALYNSDFEIAGTNGASFIQTSLRESLPINNSTVWTDGGAGTFTASSLNQAVVPLVGSYVSGQAFDFRNPTILSGIEFCDISGAPSRNEFRVINLASNYPGLDSENYFLQNPVIKCKSVGGLPRLRFDVSSYGETLNTLLAQHKFKLTVKCLVADEKLPELGGGRVGVWIHTEPQEDLMWSWTPDGKWTPTTVSSLNINQVTKKLSHTYTFQPTSPKERESCFNSLVAPEQTVNDKSINTLKEEYFQNFEVDFDTRNFTIHNNFEYLDIIPKTNEQFKITDQVHRDRNYVIEVFFLPNNKGAKYLLIDSIDLEDSTLRYEAGISTGMGLETCGIPLRPFVEEYKYKLDKEELANVLNFYNGLTGVRAGENTTPLASRDYLVTEDIMGPFGGSRINYRYNPEWLTHIDGSYDNYTEVEFDN